MGRDLWCEYQLSHQDLNTVPDSPYEKYPPHQSPPSHLPSPPFPYVVIFVDANFQKLLFIYCFERRHGRTLPEITAHRSDMRILYLYRPCGKIDVIELKIKKAIGKLLVIADRKTGK